MKIIFPLIALLIILTPAAPSAYAVESTPSASLQQKLLELKKEIASKAAKIKEELSKKLQNKAIPGEILSIDDKKIIIQTKSSQVTVLTSEDTIFQKNNIKIDLKSLKSKDYIVAQGELDDKSNLIAKKIIIQKKPQSSKIISWAEVQSIIGLTLKVKLPDGREINLDATDSKFKSNKGEADLSQLTFGTTVIFVGFKASDNETEARFIYIVGRKKIGPKLKDATKSATQSSKVNKKL